MDKPVTVLLFLKRVDCNDGVASYLETLIKGLNALGDRVVIVSGPVTELYGSEARRREIRNGVVDCSHWVAVVIAAHFLSQFGRLEKVPAVAGLLVVAYLVSFVVLRYVDQPIGRWREAWVDRRLKLVERTVIPG